jgi:hypothetical protein
MPERKNKGPKMPEWWLKPEPVDLKVEHVGEVKIFPGEYLVGFRVNGENFAGFFPTEFVSRKKKVMSALIIADVEEGWLIQIPEETFTSGPRFVIPHDEKDTVIIRDPANASL